jgi:hypothetical protein
MNTLASKEEYAKVINRFTLEFATEYCAQDGAILWAKLVKFNSGKLPEKRIKKVQNQ